MIVVANNLRTLAPGPCLQTLQSLAVSLEPGTSVVESCPDTGGTREMISPSLMQSQISKEAHDEQWLCWLQLYSMINFPSDD